MLNNDVLMCVFML